MPASRRCGATSTAARSPAAFFVVNPEQSWQRLTAYTTTGEAAVRQNIKEMVTNRFVADSFMRFVVVDNGRDLFRALRPSGLTGAPHETVSAKSRNWTMFNVAKLTHPGVQVLPGEAPSKWDSVISQWIDFTRKVRWLKDDFKTDYAEVFIYGSRNMDPRRHEQILHQHDDQEATCSTRSRPSKSSITSSSTRLTAYANVILPGVAKTDLDRFLEQPESLRQAVLGG